MMRSAKPGIARCKLRQLRQRSLRSQRLAHDLQRNQRQWRFALRLTCAGGLRDHGRISELTKNRASELRHELQYVTVRHI